MLDSEPADGAGDSALVVLDDQRAVVIADEAIGGKACSNAFVAVKP